MYAILMAIIAIFAISYSLPFLYWIGAFALLALVACTIYDGYVLKQSSLQVKGNRSVVEKLSMGDEQHIKYTLSNQSDQALEIELYDELPYQFQFREFITQANCQANSSNNIVFDIRPTERGEYQFGQGYALISNPKIGLIRFKKEIFESNRTKVFPSILQMKKYALHAFQNTALLYGIRKIRSVGENDEFEHIRPYQIGDNEKSINWKATSRANQLLVNQFQDTRSQNVYMLIDKGRSMEMPFIGLTLMDHSINTALVLSNITLKKYDKAGIITFCDKIDSLITAENSPNQLSLILEQLYAQKTSFKESNFDLLYTTMRRRVSKRSIVFLFTNFEHQAEMRRHLNSIRLINKKHLLILIMFENTELEVGNTKVVEKVDDIFTQSISEGLMNEKKAICSELNQFGVQTILTKPEQLSINVINKYLELKAKRSR